MCSVRKFIAKGPLGVALKQQDKMRSKLSDKWGLAAPRDFAAEWVHGKEASSTNYAKKPKTQLPTSQADMTAVAAQPYTIQRRPTNARV